MSRYARLFGLTVLAISLAATSGLAQTPAPQPAPQPAPRGERARPGLAGLNLTDAQRQQIRTLREHNRAAGRDQMRQLREARQSLRAEMYADAPDQNKIDALRQQMTTLAQQIEGRRLDVQQQIAQILTAEQRQFMREHRGQFRPYRARRMNRLRGGGVF